MEGQKMGQGRRSTVVVLERDLLESKAFYTLTSHAPIVLMAFLGKRQIEKVGHKGNERKIIRNNGKIIFTYAEAEKKYNLNSTKFRRAIDQLIEHGFLDIAERGGSLGKNPTKYFLSSRWKKYDGQEFEKATRTKRTIQVGYCRKN